MYHISYLSGTAGPGEEDVSTSSLAEFIGSGSCAADELADFDWVGGGEAGEDRHEDGVGVHDA
jgi:hypothetical protein